MTEGDVVQAETASQEDAAKRDELVEKGMSAVEAILLVAPEPVNFGELKNALDFLSAKELREVLEALNEKYALSEGGFVLREVAGGFQFATRPAYATFVRKVFEEQSKRRLSRAAFETLAVIAYKQPVTRADVEAIRGVNVAGTMDGLLEKGLIGIDGRKEGAGRPLLYSTTESFLKLFGIASLEDLPKEEEFS